MRSKLKVLARVPWYAVLLSAYPVVALYATNVAEVQASTLWRPLFVSLGGALVFLVAFRLIFKDWYRSAILTTILTVMFFSYGHVYLSLKTAPFMVQFSRHRLLLPVWVVLTGVGLWPAGRKSSKPVRATMLLNIVAVVALAFPLSQLGVYFANARQAQTGFTPHDLPGLTLPAGQMPPDIYYIILDAYGNTRSLTDLMDFDNTEFLNRLRVQGFYVADCSQSNYANTELSLVSSLNLNYLSAFDDAFIPGADESANLSMYLKDNATRYSLRKLGYKIVALETGFGWSEWQDADLYLSQNRWQGLNEFDVLLVNTSGLKAFYDLNLQLTPSVGTSAHRERVLYALDKLRNLPSVPGPKFVFAHIIIPHDPFDIGINGEFVDGPVAMTREAYYEGYHRQAIYINKVIPDITAAILANSSKPPVIVIQGDHGPWNYEEDSQRLGILNAYYLPQGSDSLYPTITPVNTFRVIFNAYFGGEFFLLNDISYMSSPDDKLTLTEVANPCLKK